MKLTKIVRFAPSLSGGLHAGSALVAIRNWNLAKPGGKFILRIDDTNNNHKFNDTKIIKDLNWLGIYPDLIIKSSDLNKDALLHHLLNTGNAVRLDNGAIALTKPTTKLIGWNDLYLGDITIPTDSVFSAPLILIRSDGTPTYHFASVADDILLSVTDVIRGADHISNTPKHLAIYAALGATPPNFGHLPLLLDSDKCKLSKAKSIDFSLASLRSKGLIPDAIHAFCDSIGTKSNAICDIDRLYAINRRCIRNSDPRYIAALMGLSGNSLAIGLPPLGNWDSLASLYSYTDALRHHNADTAYKGMSNPKAMRIALTGLSYGPDINKIVDLYRKLNKLTYETIVDR